jgi:hypothetical protein
MTKTATMAKKKAPADMHRPRKMTAIRGHFVEPAERLRERLGMKDLTELVNQALREKLEREGLWPVPGQLTPGKSNGD